MEILKEALLNAGVDLVFSEVDTLLKQHELDTPIE